MRAPDRIDGTVPERDLEAVDALATVISRLAQAHAEGDGASSEDIWAAGARAIGWGGPTRSGS